MHTRKHFCWKLSLLFDFLFSSSAWSSRFKMSASTTKLLRIHVSRGQNERNKYFSSTTKKEVKNAAHVIPCWVLCYVKSLFFALLREIGNANIYANVFCIRVIYSCEWMRTSWHSCILVQLSTSALFETAKMLYVLHKLPHFLSTYFTLISFSSLSTEKFVVYDKWIGFFTH